jgi:hypothetical protein
MQRLKSLIFISLTGSFCFLLYYFYSINFNDEIQILRSQFEVKNAQVLMLRNEIEGL